ncbi:MAG: hypothetical protein KGY81_03080, partial [Phycisphaerae bacterium]|nr:hypothetical protein [Phycisphaerae bacterium]
MAISNESRAPEMTLDRRLSMAAAVATLALAVGTMVTLAVLLVRADALAGSQQIIAVVWFAFMGAVGVTGAYLLAGRRTAAFFLMVVWLVIAASAVLAAFHWLLGGGVPLGLSVGWGIAVVLLAILVPAAIVAVLVAAVPDGTRSRYGSLVGVSVVSVVVVVAVVNMISFANPVQQDFEQLGRFGLSQRARDIVRQVEEPMTISTVYTAATSAASTDEARTAKADAEARLQRVNELLVEVHRANPRIEVADASGEAARALLMARLRERQQGRTGQHQALLDQLLAVVEELKQAVDAEQAAWKAIADDSFVAAQWDFGATVADTLAQAAGSLQQTDRVVRDQLAASPLPDYVALLDQMTRAIDTVRSVNDAVAQRLEQMAAIPPAARENAPAATDALARATRAVTEARTIVGKPDAPDPAGEPAEIIQRLTDAVGQAAVRMREAATELDNVAGDDPDVRSVLAASRAWRTDFRLTLPDRLSLIARQIEDLRARLAVMLQDANEAALKREVADIRQPLDEIVTLAQSTRSTAAESLQALQNVDAASKRLFASAEDGKPLGRLSALLTDRVNRLLDKTETLEAPTEEGKLPAELSQENIIVIEAGETIKVLSYEDVWPPYVAAAGGPDTEEDTRRFFNGDAALASALLDLTHDEPFARVLLAYTKIPTPPGVSPMQFNPPTGPIPPRALTELRQRLKEANFSVAEWNLAEPMPRADTGEDGAETDEAGPVGPDTDGEPATKDKPDLPTVLLVLPPAPQVMMRGAPPMGGLSDEQLGRVRQAIDDGASAIFLAQQLPPRRGPMGMPMPSRYGWNRYLEDDWGLSVEVDKWVIETVPGETLGQYRLGPTFYFLRMSGFGSGEVAERVGKPLRGRRLFWPYACPVTWDGESLPGGVQAEPLLEVPETDKHIWAVADAQGLSERFRQGRDEIAPDVDNGDLLPPITLAVAATRPGDADRAAARLMVLGIGGGMTDGVVSSPMMYMSDRGLRTLEPARANPE